MTGRRRCLDDEWYFSKSDLDDAKEILFDHSGWRQINLPHDWSVEADFEKNAPTGKNGGFLGSGVGWYRKVIQLKEGITDKHIFLEFDGVFAESRVFVNGVEAGYRPYGYISFGYDISGLLTEGINILAVRVDCQKRGQSRWFNGCGIYRHVWLTITDRLRVRHWGTYITTPEVTEKQASVECEITLCNERGSAQQLQVISSIINSDGICCGEVCTDRVMPVGETVICQQFSIRFPALWSPETPVLYRMETKIIAQGQTIDQYNTSFGIRRLEYIPNRGFYLNGEPYLFKGVCQHHDAGIVGAAVPEKLLRKRLILLKEMGCNAIRTAHNPFAPEFYDLCDELGFLVMDEIFDGWDIPKAENDYGLYFDEWYRRDIADFVRRDRNHPSVVIWSIGNEVTNMRPELAAKLQELFHQLDPTRPVTCGVQGTSLQSDHNRTVLDIAGYNDGGGACFIYEQDHEKRPDQLMIATEAPHTCHTRGFYRTQTWWRDKNQPRIEIENLSEEEIFFDGHLLFNSSYDNAGVRTCARDSWSIAQRLPYLCGEFRWTGFDYYGESLGWPARMSNSGVIDAANICKDHYYLYQSMWLNPETCPMIHLLPHWSHPELAEGTKIPVWIYTNCDEAELFLNGQSLGRKEKGSAKHLQWQVAYQMGKLEAVAYYRGDQVCSKSYCTAGIPSQIHMESDAKELLFDGRDITQITCTICDDKGVMVPQGENTVHFFTTGGIEIIGTENGNPIDMTTLTSHKRSAFYGFVTALMRAKPGFNGGTAFAVSILGRKVFQNCNTVYIDMKMQVFGKQEAVRNYEIYYTCDLTEPTTKSIPYRGGFTITKTTLIKAAVYIGHSLICVAEELFSKGEREKVIDLTHGNKPLSLARPAGPFSSKICGVWSDETMRFCFKPDGELVRMIDVNKEQHIGYWWYDFPVDAFEAQEYAGTGEIWFASGEKAEIHLVSQLAVELVVDNRSGAIGTAYGHADAIRLKLMESSFV